ncbi:hypothetical protein ACOME3_001802 [Neoechinorhynchus agilis]
MDQPAQPRGPKTVPVKNKLPAPIQITAEQLLREAKEKQLEFVAPPPRQTIADSEELDEFKLRKRKDFEDAVRKNRQVLARWIRYANWEESQNELDRARSVWERALDVDHRSVSVWLKYIAMEMRCKQISHARNVLDRATRILPRANQLWYKYVFMEEVLGNIAGTRAVFERWLEWKPDEAVWNTYVNFEIRYGELERARVVFERLVAVHPEHRNWIRLSRFEERNGDVERARKVFEDAIEFFGDAMTNDRLLLAFAAFEERQKEFERALLIYKYGLDKLSDSEQRTRIFDAYTSFERKHGTISSTEKVVLSKRKYQYERDLEDNPRDYDIWFDYIKLLTKLEETVDASREAFERAIAQVPASSKKRDWRRYIYIWIKYAIFEELTCKDVDRTREVYRSCLSLIPHSRFTFAKIWIMFAHFEIRQKDVNAARKIMGNGIGRCPKDKLFRAYIDMEINLREFGRCRKLYEKFLDFSPENGSTWVKFAELENLLGEIERARYIYDTAVSGEYGAVDMPEGREVWKHSFQYIEFEISNNEYHRVRQLYERLLRMTQNVKVYTSLALFEAKFFGTAEGRKVFNRAYNELRGNGEIRAALVEQWIEFEESEAVDDGDAERVKCLRPKKVERKRRKINEHGESEETEFVDLVFPDEEEAVDPSFKLLSIAKAWKLKQQQLSSINEH